MLRSLRSVTRGLRRVRGVNTRAACMYSNGMSSTVLTASSNLSGVQVSQTRTFAAGAQITGNVGDVIEFPLADIGEGIKECEVLQWFVKAGDTIKQFDKICEVQSDKANVEITSRYDGVIQELKYKVGEMAQVGEGLMSIKLTTATARASGKTAAPAAAAAKTATATTGATPACAFASNAVLDTPRSNDAVLASPVVRRMAMELGILLGRVKPTGLKGQVTKEDLIAFQAQSSNAPSIATTVAATETVAAVSPLSSIHATTSAVDKQVTIAGIQKVMVKSMTAAANVPTLGFADEFCADNLMALRKKLVERAKSQGVKLSPFAFIIKALSLALTKYPNVNSLVNSDCTAFTVKGSHNIGLAMDTPKGLLVPNIKNVQDKSVLQIAAELNRLQALGKDGKLGTDDLRGGTITLSNIGTIGGTYCSPILVVPEVCIGALGKFYTKAAFDEDGNVYPSTVFNVGWTADHRILDGATVARFSNEFKDYIENPEAMILH